MTDKARLVILSAGGTAKDVVSIVADINRRNAGVYEIVGFLDDNLALANSTVMGKPILGTLSSARDLDPDIQFVNALGSPRSFRQRPELVRTLGIPNDRFATIIHPSAILAEGVRIGRGCLIYPNVVMMTDSCLADHVTVLANSTINHDTFIGAYSILASGVQVSGNVRVGGCCYLGSSSCLIQGIQVGDLALIGMGATVIRSVEAGKTVVGNPARVIE